MITQRIHRLLFLLLSPLLLLAAGCARKGGQVDLSGTDLGLEATSSYFDSLGEEILSYHLEKAVMKNDGDIVFVHSFQNLSDLRITGIVCEFYYYEADGTQIAHKRLSKELSETPVAPNGIYTYYSTNNFQGAVPSRVEARITEASTENEIPVLPPPQENSGLFDFFTDGRYQGLILSFAAEAPTILRVERDGEDTVVVTDEEEIRSVFEALGRMQVGGESEERVTDSGLRYTFITPDGTEYAVRFESRNLVEYGTRCYEIVNDGGLFSLKLTEAPYSREDGSNILEEPEG